MFDQKLNKRLDTCTNTNSKSNLQKHHRKRVFTLFSLMFVLVLVLTVVYTTTDNNSSTFASATYTVDKTVNNAQELRAAVEAARGVTSEYVIELAKDIALTDTPLTISANANVVLISKGTTAMKLIGPKGMNTIHVAGGGKLVLDGIIVTHASGELGRGVYVDFSAALILNSGEITENNIYTGGVTGDAQYGGGVYIAD